MGALHRHAPEQPRTRVTTSDSHQDARYAAIYDVSEGPERDDFEAYAAMVAELGATSALEAGCGKSEPGALGGHSGLKFLGRISPERPSSAAAQIG